MERINVSVTFDRRLADQDIAQSRAHVRMLADQGIVDRPDAEAILGGLDRVAEEIRITLLHELGHQFGLDEDDLAELGYD